MSRTDAAIWHNLRYLYSCKHIAAIDHAYGGGGSGCQVPRTAPVLVGAQVHDDSVLSMAIHFETGPRSSISGIRTTPKRGTSYVPMKTSSSCRCTESFGREILKECSKRSLHIYVKCMRVWKLRTNLARREANRPRWSDKRQHQRNDHPRPQNVFSRYSRRPHVIHYPGKTMDIRSFLMKTGEAQDKIRLMVLLLCCESIL